MLYLKILNHITELCHVMNYIKKDVEKSNINNKRNILYCNDNT